mmetsp:Transcript_39950/g.97027  ORF Transcript_39950/g.97027 Transcript_39950/m.97027 type:complete len:211 (-) Transcript_39950:303-935(-)
MLKSTIWPTTHTPESACSMPCRSPVSASDCRITCEKDAHVAITQSSEEIAGPGVIPIGMKAPPSSLFGCPTENAASTMPQTRTSASMFVPLKTCLSFSTNSVRREMRKLANFPSAKLNSRVRTTLSVAAATIVEVGFSGSSAACARPWTIPNVVSTMDASRGAHKKTILGSGCPLYCFTISSIFGITSPSPRAHTEVASVAPCTAVKPRV